MDIERCIYNSYGYCKLLKGYERCRECSYYDVGETERSLARSLSKSLALRRNNEIRSASNKDE
jgi:hypothetical protein